MEGADWGPRERARWDDGPRRERDMIGGATTASLADMEIPKADANKTNEATRGTAVLKGAAAYASVETDSLHMKLTSKDGDVLEVDLEHTEATFAGVAFSTEEDAPAGHACARPSGASAVAGANAEAAQPAEAGGDARLEKLARLREWAAQVAEEVRKQQKRILEESLKRSGKFMPGCEGRFIVVYEAQDGTGAADAADKGDKDDCEAGIPEYWNAENTSDRIVHLTTQMAEIAGNDSDFAETIMKAVADGFDQANGETGPLPGAAGELNRKTRELTFSKLSKWLEERKAAGYNQGARTEDNPTLVASHGTQNNEQ